MRAYVLHPDIRNDRSRRLPEHGLAEAVSLAAALPRLAKEMGFFEKHGLDITFVTMESAAVATAALKVVTTNSPTSPSATKSPVPGRTISTMTPSSSTKPSRAEVS